MESRNDFSKGSIARNILSLALPMTLAQLINVLYSIVDRIYIGHIPHTSAEALTGIGLALPIITIITAFANLFGMGGAPLCSIARGGHEERKAQCIMGNSFSMLLVCGGILMVSGLLFKRPLLYLFGASDATFPYADAYLTIYLLGTIFVMISLGMNNFINSQGFGKTGMFTVLLGAVFNIILDPVLIFGFHMGVRGAAVATVISQGASALWVLKFLTGKKAILKLSRDAMRIDVKLVKEIVLLGAAGFIMYITNGTVQIVCNAMLSRYGGDVYVGIMTVINSVREIITMPVTGLTSGAQPVIGYNYGAECYTRVKSAIKFMAGSCMVFTVLMWAVLFFEPRFFLHLFTNEPELIQKGIPAMRLYFCGIFMMALQFSGQSTYQALNLPKPAIFFSLFRKIIIVVPLTLLLPMVAGLGTDGVFLAEPISNAIGGTASFVTMLITVWPTLKKTSA
ncbi:MATE family efflux transporter [Faecalicatena acetigenes]|uniref:Multidrug export protein MepA n=1 Tax=Faecalicatena acetigenes TaxID=2981790 RepID=A0ABT2TFI9_9FIRM|nr:MULTISPECIES: MATE family efflux transporter [Lachnospiraceae]MCU6748572.1 MATE family efflux transporter [Faecalicatena acetigenes]SCI52279.1 Staphylococcal virulence regulator protein A [uncultured Clostridium sp.]